MGIAQDLVTAGYGGYQGWGDAGAEADFNATGGSGKFTGGGGGGSSGSVPAFNFDYAAEATKAYGELGAYYERLLKESQGDMNKVLSRLVEDYDRGLRIQKEDVAFAKEGLGNEQQRAEELKAREQSSLVDRMLARGLYRKSAYGPDQGMGIPDTEKSKLESDFAYGQTGRDRRLGQIDTAFNRYTEAADISKSRTTVDTKEAQVRKEADYERQRRLEAAEMSNLRGQQAYQKFSSSLT